MIRLLLHLGFAGYFVLPVKRCGGGFYCAGSIAPDRFVAVVAVACPAEGHGEPDRQPDAHGKDGTEELLDMVDGLAVKVDLPLAVPTEGHFIR
jgi:hypothetical protein